MPGFSAGYHFHGSKYVKTADRQHDQSKKNRPLHTGERDMKKFFNGACSVDGSRFIKISQETWRSADRSTWCPASGYSAE